MARRLSDDGARFIEGQEGSRDFWYRDRLGHWTLGIGHLGDPAVEFIDVATEDDLSRGRRLSRAEIYELFRTDQARYVEAVDRLVTVALTQRQFDMLVDFAFNWGIGTDGGFPASSVLRLVNAGDFAGVAHELVHGRGPKTAKYPEGRPYDKGLEGVRNRRILNAEAFKVAPMSSADILRAVAADLEAQGIPVQFISGWATRGRPFAFNPRGVVCHHTATKAYAHDYPSLGIVRDGRSDLPGPLAQIGLGRHTGTVYIIAQGTSNHAGGGGWDGLVGNTSVWGIEAENDGIGEAWGPEITRSYIATVAALCLHTGIDPSRVCRHAEWSDGGKIDTATAPFNRGDWIRARVAEALAATPDNPSEEDDNMALPIFGDAPENRDGGLWMFFGGFRKRVHTPQVWSAWEALGSKHIGVADVAMFDASLDIEAALVARVVVPAGDIKVDTAALAEKVADVIHGRMAS